MGRQALVGPATRYIAGEFRAQQAREKLTLDEIAEASGLSRATVNRALKGESAIAFEAIFPMCAALGLDALKILEEAQARSRTED